MRTKNLELMQDIRKFIDSYYLAQYRSPSNTEIAEEFGLARSTVHRYLVEMGERGIISYEGRIIRTEVTEKTNLRTTRAAVVGSIACGQPNFAEENIEEYISLPEAMFGKGEFYILRARGESMIEAGIDDGDLVVVRKQDEALDGTIVVALVDNEATLKRFYREPEHNRIRLHPENTSMEDIYVDNCIIQGVAVKVLKDLI